MDHLASSANRPLLDARLANVTMPQTLSAPNVMRGSSQVLMGRHVVLVTKPFLTVDPAI